MGLLDLLTRRGDNHNTEQPEQKELMKFVPVQGGTLGNVSPITKTEDYINAYTGWVFDCVSVISSSLARLSYGLWNGTTEIEEHLFLEVLKKPNQLLTGEEFRELSHIYVDLAGEVFWIIERNGVGAPAELWIAPPQQVTILTSKTGLITAYRMQNESGQIDVPFEDVIHHKQPNPKNQYRGMSTVEAIALTYDNDRYAQVYNRSFYENSAVDPCVIGF